MRWSKTFAVAGCHAAGGLIQAKCTCKDGKVTEVEFSNVPAFVHDLDKPVEVEGLGAGRDAVVSTIAGQAWITGIGQFGLDPADPYPEGHILSDAWF